MCVKWRGNLRMIKERERDNNKKIGDKYRCLDGIVQMQREGK